MDQGLKIKVGADVVEVTKSLSELEADFKDLQKTIIKTTDGKELISLNKQLDNLGSTIKALKNAGRVGFDDVGQKLATSLNKIKNPASSAQFALVNLGRVAQDFPFGFIGIANNLNPLLESFQRLSVEAGGAGGAMKALGKSLTGAGGLGLALSLVTSALSISQLGFGAWTRGFGSAKKEVNSFADTIKELVKPIGDITAAATGNVQGEIGKVNALISVIKDQTASRKEQENALKSLRDINKAYFGDLTLEENSIKKLTSLQNEYTQSIVRASIIKSLESEIGKVGAEVFKRQREINEQVRQTIDLTRELQHKNADLIKQNADKGIRTFFIDDDANKIGAINAKIKDQRKELQPLQEQFNKLNAELTDFVRTGLDLKPLKVDKIKKDVDKTIVYIQQGLTPIDIPIRLKNDDTIKIKEIFHKIQSNLDAVSFGGFSIFNKDQVSQDAYQAYYTFKKYWEDQQRKDPLFIDTSKLKVEGINSDYWKYFSDNVKNAIQKLKEFRDEAEAITNVFGGPLADTVAGVFRTIAQDGKISIRAVGDALKQLIVDLIATTIRAAVLAAVLKLIGGGNVASFGSLFKSNLLGLPSSGTGLASGGIVPSGYPNDTFPARLSSGEAVIPLDRINSIMGGGLSGPVSARLVGAGPDLILYLEQQRKSQARSF